MTQALEAGGGGDGGFGLKPASSVAGAKRGASKDSTGGAAGAGGGPVKRPRHGGVEQQAGGTLPRLSRCVCVIVCLCVCACVCVYVSVCVCVQRYIVSDSNNE